MMQGCSLQRAPLQMDGGPPMECASCGASLPDGAKYCSKCGMKADVSGTTGKQPKPQARKQDDEALFETALSMVGTVAQLPIIRVDREAFLKSQFGSSAQLDRILSDGPQAVFSPESLRRRADRIIAESTGKTAAVSFVSGLPSNPVTMVAAGGADVVQYFGFALNLAQQLAYLFGEDDLFADGQTDMPESSKIRVIAYLGAMLGAAGAAQLISKTSVKVGANLGKKIAAQALTKTAWYPLLKKVGALVGQNITKKTVEKTVAKAVPILGGVVSGALTFVTFQPMGARLADVLRENLESCQADEDVMEAGSGQAALDATDVLVSSVRVG